MKILSNLYFIKEKSQNSGTFSRVYPRIFKGNFLSLWNFLEIKLNKNLSHYLRHYNASSRYIHFLIYLCRFNLFVVHFYINKLNKTWKALLHHKSLFLKDEADITNITNILTSKKFDIFLSLKIKINSFLHVILNSNFYSRKT